MEARTLLDDIQSYLELSAKVREESVQGKEINVGEMFVVTFQVLNNSYPSLSPDFNFKNIRLFLKESKYAKLVTEKTAYLFKFDGLLEGQQSVTLDVEFKAVANIGGFRDLFESELIAEAFIEAELDLPSFFKVVKAVNVSSEIKEN